MSQLCLYTVAKFIPDIVRYEPRNIGIIIFSETTKEYRSRFAHNFRNKVGKTMSSDIAVMKEYDRYFKKLLPNSKEDIVKSTSSSSGKIQFTEIKGVVTENIDSELEYLFDLFIGEKVISKETKHRLRTTIKQDFQEHKLLGSDKLIYNNEIEGGKSSVAHTIDFTHQNGILTAIETVDFSVLDKKSNVFETAFKFEDLIRGLGNKKIKAYSVIKKSQEDKIDNEYLSILKSVSNVYDFEEQKELDIFYKTIKQVVL